MLTTSFAYFQTTLQGSLYLNLMVRLERLNVYGCLKNPLKDLVVYPTPNPSKGAVDVVNWSTDRSAGTVDRSAGTIVHWRIVQFLSRSHRSLHLFSPGFTPSHSADRCNCISVCFALLITAKLTTELLAVQHVGSLSFVQLDSLISHYIALHDCVDN